MITITPRQCCGAAWTWPAWTRREYAWSLGRSQKNMCTRGRRGGRGRPHGSAWETAAQLQCCGQSHTRMAPLPLRGHLRRQVARATIH